MQHCYCLQSQRCHPPQWSAYCSGFLLLHQHHIPKHSWFSTGYIMFRVYTAKIDSMYLPDAFKSVYHSSKLELRFEMSNMTLVGTISSAIWQLEPPMVVADHGTFCRCITGENYRRCYVYEYMTHQVDSFRTCLITRIKYHNDVHDDQWK